VPPTAAVESHAGGHLWQPPADSALVADATAPPPAAPGVETPFDAQFSRPAAVSDHAWQVAAVDPILEAHFEAHFGGRAFESAPAREAEQGDTWTSGGAAPVSVAELYVEPAAAPEPYLESEPAAASCESCGGPTPAAGLCGDCEQRFHPLLARPAAEPLSLEPAAPIRVVEAPAAVVPVLEPEVLPRLEPPSVAAVGAAAPIRIKPRADVVILPEPPAPVVEAAAPSRKAARPAAAVAVPVATATPARGPSRVKALGATAAVLVAVAALGFPFGKFWLASGAGVSVVRGDGPAVRSELPDTAERAAVPVPAPAGSAPVPVAPVLTAASAAAPLKKVAPAPKTSTAAGRRAAGARVPSKGVKPPAPARAAAPVAVPIPVAPAPAPEAVAPLPAPAPKPEPPPAAVGRFFELRDVNESPRVVTRVEPRVPDDLRGTQFNEVVIVRVLVTQSGHPLMVNLLRRSKSGATLDEAIVAAVKQWTFVAAKRRGEAVSCWYHVGVPVNGQS
jgi:protein TonB